MTLASKMHMIGITGCILLASIVGAIAVAHNYFDNSIFFDIAVWALFLGAILLFKMRTIPEVKKSSTFWVGLFFVVGIAATIITWAPWAFDYLWENKGNVALGGSWIASGVCTFGIFLVSTLGFLFPLRWSNLISFRKKFSLLFLMCLLMLAAASISTLCCWLIVRVTSTWINNTPLILWITNTIVCFSLFLVWYLVIIKKWFDVDKETVSSAASATSEKDFAAVVLLAFPLMFTGLLVVISYCDENYWKGSFFEGAFGLVVPLICWLLCFYLFLFLRRGDRNDYHWTRSTMLLLSMVMAVFAWTRGGIGFLWGYPGNLADVVEASFFPYEIAEFLVLLISLLLYTLVSLVVVCRLKSVDLKSQIKKRAGGICFQAFLLALFLLAANEVTMKIYIEGFAFMWGLQQLPWAVVYVFIFFSIYMHTLKKEYDLASKNRLSNKGAVIQAQDDV